MSSSSDVSRLPAHVTATRRRSVAFARLASCAVTVAAVGVVIGWLTGTPGLTSLYLPGPTLKTNPALCLMCLGLANLLLISSRAPRLRLAARLLAGFSAMVSLLTLSQHVIGWDLGIDQLLASEPVGAFGTVSPNRMGPPASTAIALLGTAMLVVDLPSRLARALGQACALLSCAIAILPLIGYAYGVVELYSLARYTGIALITAIALLILGIAVQAGRPGQGLASLMCRGDEVGLFTRRLLVAGIFLPFAIGWVLARLIDAGLMEPPFGIATMALALIFLLAALIWSTGKQLARSTDARAETERALAASERSLREADQQKTEFLATLSHELRNPLAPIRFALELLSGPPVVAERARQSIDRQVQHLTRLIDDLLDLTRITRNKLELRVRVCELHELVRDAVDAVAAEVSRSGHRLDVDLPSQPVWLRADPDRVVQMLVNLLTNAARYSDSGGRIDVGATFDGTHATIFVRDSGQGIEPADLQRVFERFVQLGKGRQGGLGIGLALVKALAELHGGTVEARSEGSGKGAEFRLRLPCSAVPPNERVADGVRGVIGARRILVADDNRDAADMLAGVLEAAGHDVVVAYDGGDALRQARDFAPEVALLDIGMPHMDGYQLASRLRAELQPGDLFLVAITGLGRDEDRRRALESGFDAHLTKPAGPDALHALLAARFSPRRATAAGG